MSEAKGVIESRVDSRTIAMLAEWMVRRGTPCITKSELVRSALEVLAEMLVFAGEVKRIDTLADAEEMLLRLGYKLLDRSGRRAGERRDMRMSELHAGYKAWAQDQQLAAMATRIAQDLERESLEVRLPPHRPTQSAEAYELASQQEVAMFDSGMSNINQMTQEEKDKLIDELMKAQEAQRQVE